MRRMVLLGLLVLFVAPVVCAGEKVNAPVWHVGDKWVFTQGNIEVIGADKNRFALNFSKDTCILENAGFETIIYEKSTLNRIYTLREDKREKYAMALSKILDFPLSTGKQWKTVYSSMGPGAWSQVSYNFSEIYNVLGWEDIVVQAGKFKALRVEYKRVVTDSSRTWEAMGGEIIHQYWYSPEMKYFVKCQYDLKDWMKQDKQIFNWELISFQLKK
jgi:hypothetical protein